MTQIINTASLQRKSTVGRQQKWLERVKNYSNEQKSSLESTKFATLHRNSALHEQHEGRKDGRLRF